MRIPRKLQLEVIRSQGLDAIDIEGDEEEVVLLGNI